MNDEAQCLGCIIKLESYDWTVAEAQGWPYLRYDVPLGPEGEKPDGKCDKTEPPLPPACYQTRTCRPEFVEVHMHGGTSGGAFTFAYGPHQKTESVAPGAVVVKTLGDIFGDGPLGDVEWDCGSVARLTVSIPNASAFGWFLCSDCEDSTFDINRI